MARCYAAVGVIHSCPTARWSRGNAPWRDVTPPSPDAGMSGFLKPFGVTTPAE
jgi:hypothetical protein